MTFQKGSRMRPHTNHSKSGDLDPFFDNGDPYFAVTKHNAARTNRSSFALICGCSIITFSVLLLGSLVTWKNVLYFGGLGCSLMVILAYALKLRLEHEELRQKDGPTTDFPTVMPPANSKPGEINYFVPTGETGTALRSLVLMTHAPCSTLKGVINVIVITRRRPNGIRYSMKSFRANDECMDILSLYVPESDALGCKYHAKLRQDLIHGAQRTLDVKLEHADGSVNELKNLSVYKSA